MSKYDYDPGIIGGGAAGLTSAAEAAQFGAKAILIDKSAKNYFTQEGLDLTPQLHAFRKPALCEELSVKTRYHGIRNDLKWL
jgi:thioredoxin reductase